MKAVWQTKKLGQIISLEYGKPLEPHHREVNGLYPVYGANGAIGQTNKFYHDKPSIVVGRKGSAGEINLTVERFWPLDVTYFVTFDESNYVLKFIYYLLSKLNLPSLAKGVKPGINRNEVYELDVNIPSVQEQQRIVAILDQALEGIAKARANAEQNLQNVRALFESHLQSVFTQRGEGWVVSRLGDISELIDSLHKTPVYIEDGYPMVRVTDIKTGALNLSNTRKVSAETYLEFSKRHKAKLGDIVFSRVGSYGVSSYVSTGEPFCLGQNTVFIIPKINPSYLYLFLNSPNAKEQIDNFVDGTTQPTISLKSIKEILIPITPPNMQDTIVNKVSKLQNETQRLEALYQRKIVCLDELKKSLLQQAFAGEL